jgi:hypothetical protein
MDGGGAPRSRTATASVRRGSRQQDEHRDTDADDTASDGRGFTPGGRRRAHGDGGRLMADRVVLVRRTRRTDPWCTPVIARRDREEDGEQRRRHNHGRDGAPAATCRLGSVHCRER